MSPDYATAEQYQRWYMRTCARCGRHAAKAANWSDGPICRTCLDRALKSYGPCPGCGTDRLLPGRNTAGQPVCRDCAGITRNFTCTRCQAEGYLRAGLCRRCTLTDDLQTLLDDGTGSVNPRLVGLFHELTTMANPASGMLWLRGEQTRALLSDLATGRLPLTHQTLDDQPNWHAAAYLRDLLMRCGALPPADRQLVAFQRWLRQFLTGISDPAHAAVLTRYATWNQLRTLRAKAGRGGVRYAQIQSAKRELNYARILLEWLAGRGLTPVTTRQADLDTWAAEGRAGYSQPERPFLAWCVKTGEMPALRIPPRPPTRSAIRPLDQADRLAAIRRLAHDDSLPERARVAGLIVLLCAQPVTKIVRLTLHDIAQDGDQMVINLGDPPTPVPEPLAAILRAYQTRRPNMTTATNPDTDWLFPGRRANQPMHPATMLGILHRIGVPAGSARMAAIRELVTQMPPPVAAQALGYHQTSVAKIAAQAGNPWAGYAAGDHTR